MAQVAGRQTAFAVVVVVQGQPDLPQIVGAVYAVGCLARFLNSWQQQANQRTEPAAEQRPEMLAAQVHFQQRFAVQRRGAERNAAQAVADGAGQLLGADYQRRSLAEGQRFLAIGAERQVDNAIPLATGGAA